MSPTQMAMVLTQVLTWTSSSPTEKQKPPVTRRFVDGSDGTRTRDLRRDRPAF